MCNAETLPQRHGGLQERDLEGTGLRAADALDFSTNVNPLGPPPGVREAVAAVDLSRYPDPDCLALREALSAEIDVPAESILVGNGSAELIHLLVRLFVHRGQRPVVFAPTFSEFERAVTAVGGHSYPWVARPERKFRWTLRNKPAVLDRVQAPLVWLCNPNNPTGVYLGQAEVAMIAASLTGGPLVLDEAYVQFVRQPWRSLALIQNGRVIVLRSMTKDYALAGLRLGYVVAHPDVVTAAASLQPQWSVSSVAQAAGLAALKATGYLERAAAVIAEAKAFLVDALTQREFDVTEGAANFLLVRVGDAGAVRSRLLQRGIAVRDCASFGLPDFIRIGVRTLPDCRRLVDAITALQITPPTGGQ